MTHPGLSIVDAHAHVWTRDPEFPWSPAAIDPPSYEANPDALLAEMARESVTAAVLVQYIGYRWNNEYVARAIKAAPDKFAGVCRVDPEDPEAPDHLSYWKEERGFHGVRLSPEPGARGDWFRGPLMDPFFKRAAELGIPVLVLTKAERLPELARILDRHPDVDVVIDHFADCDVNVPDHLQSLKILARNPRVFLKTGHMWASSHEGYPWRDKHAVIKEARELFDATRIMWGSDWSLSLRHATYGQTISYLRDHATFLSKKELAWILGGTARRLWDVPSEVKPMAGSTLSSQSENGWTARRSNKPRLGRWN